MLANKPKPAPVAMHVKKGDKVVVTSGQYKSNEPREVLKVDAETGKVIVQGVNLRWKHQKRSQQNPKGGRIQLEQHVAFLHQLVVVDGHGRDLSGDFGAHLNDSAVDERIVGRNEIPVFEIQNGAHHQRDNGQCHRGADKLFFS